MPSVVTRFNGSCLDLINNSTKKWDVCFADPPYGIGYQSAWRIDTDKWKPKIKNDEKPYTEWLAPLYSKMNDGGRLICFYRWDVQDEFIEAIERAGFEIKSQLVWDKVVHGMGDLKGEFAPQHELAFYATKSRYEFTGKRPKTVYRVQRINGDDLIHPNEKPVELVMKILRDISNRGDNIIDPFAGSFSTACACYSVGLDCDTSELDPYYFRIGNERFLSLTDFNYQVKDHTNYSQLNTGLFAQNA